MFSSVGFYNFTVTYLKEIISTVICHSPERFRGNPVSLDYADFLDPPDSYRGNDNIRVKIKSLI